MCSRTLRPRRPATPPHSPRTLKRSVRPRSAAAISLLVLPILLASCTGSREPLVLSADRVVAEVPCTQHADGRCHEVTPVWLQERYQLERALRLRLDQCEAERDLSRRPHP
jgi:hypothetical protein